MDFKRFFFRCIPLLLSLGGLQACSSEVESATKNWPTECVGRMQLQLPGPVDLAATFNASVKSFRAKEDRPIHRPSFPDGTPAPFANSISISHPLTEIEKAKFLKFAEAEEFEVVDRAADGRKLYKFARGFQRIEFPVGKGFGLKNKKVIDATYFVGDSLVKWTLSHEIGEVYLKARPRPTFEVPKEPGLCLPYIFVPDDGKSRRGLSMSYRLKDHPDIQITLTDASAFKPERLNADGQMPEAEVKLRNKHAEPEQEIGYFWLERLNAARKYESQWLIPDTTKPVTLAGYKGLQSFVRLTMDDGTLNYGYFAVVRGNPDAAEDTPDLRLYVRQDVQQAQGKTPLTKEQFIDMAQAIAKSVQRRATAPN
jgi:Tle cognate immunity protein 4 C-terminal domain